MLEIRVGLKDTLDENEIFGIEMVENMPSTRLFIIGVMDETILFINGCVPGSRELEIMDTLESVILTVSLFSAEHMHACQDLTFYFYI
jgi:hypothetical protein